MVWRMMALLPITDLTPADEISGTFLPRDLTTMLIPRAANPPRATQETVVAGCFTTGPWAGLPIPAGSRGASEAGAVLWVIRLHDDPLDFVPVFVESEVQPWTQDPAVVLGRYVLGEHGWEWMTLI